MANRFGGEWTEEKLGALQKYLNFYCEALKNQKFKKIYIDCFAGSGKIKLKDGSTIEGSAQIALNVEPAFDEYYFIEFEKENVQSLNNLKTKYPNKKISILKGDCNEVLPELLKKIDWRFNRGILFIDPYATQFKFATLEFVAKTKSIDVWYLFPLSAVNRLLKRDGKIDEKWEERINDCLGTYKWKTDLYEEDCQINMFGEQSLIKKDSKIVYKFIVNRMQDIFSYVSPNYMELRNSNNAPLFLLFLLISSENPKVYALVKRVEKYILKD